MRFLNVLVIITLLASYAGGMVSPEKFWPLAFMAMGYPIILGALTILSLYWIRKRKWFVFLNLALLLVKADYVLGTVGIHSDSSADQQGLKVMTYNVRLFDKYNWNSQSKSKNGIISLIGKEEPDILCIQEYYDEKGQVLAQLDSTKGLNIHLRNYYAQRNNSNDFGVATISRFPIMFEGKIVLENSRSALAIFTDLIINEDTVRVYNIHLQSIHLGTKGYEVLDELLQGQQVNDLSDNRLLLGRLKHGFIKRSVQARKIAAHIATSPYPVIVCGDFNDVPTSYTYQTIADGLTDTFIESGKGVGATYVRVPFFRIDNILHDGQFSSLSHHVYDTMEFSDHYAVSAKLRLKD
ncbi:MAG: endonuclease/exonuclease/phosphatase family protein [Flavobacteriales bacterium]|nr:endonuclease/exonuclease/phosphatase family protein [Flavobacteriales bacterium]MCB9204677.1 endonuclease/exonuclease/phosphatase family protein [Flavobacteriales bacterium]